MYPTLLFFSWASAALHNTEMWCNLQPRHLSGSTNRNVGLLRSYSFTEVSLVSEYKKPAQIYTKSSQDSTHASYSVTAARRDLSEFLKAPWPQGAEIPHVTSAPDFQLWLLSYSLSTDWLWKVTAQCVLKLCPLTAVNKLDKTSQSACWQRISGLEKSESTVGFCIRLCFGRNNLW